MLTKIKEVEKRGTHKYSLYRCVCGTEKIIRDTAVNSGETKSCGCHRKKQCKKTGKKSRTHGQSGTYLYQLWQEKIKKNCSWNSFGEFFKWAKPLWRKGLILYSESGYYNTECKFIPSKESKTLLLKKHRGWTDDSLKKFQETSLLIYGTKNPSQSTIVKQTTINNNRKKYGVDYPQQLEENRRAQKQRAVTKIGFDSEEWARKLGVSRSHFNANVRKYGFDQAINMSKGLSNIELIIQNWLDGNNIKYEHDYILGKFRSDFLLLDYNIIIEADGLYWHSDAVNDNYKYHREKLDYYEGLGYKAMFFRENELITKSNIVFSIINNALNNSNKIFARKCNIIELDLQTRKHYFNDNHLMGCGRGNCLALEYNGKVVAGLQYTIRNNILDVSRFCNILNTSVIGGFSKLLKHVELKEKPDYVTTFIDRRYGSGTYLLDFGFEKTTDRLSFCWVKNEEVCHRLKYRGNSGYKFGYYKLWDCGQVKYKKISRSFLGGFFISRRLILQLPSLDST